MLDAHRYEPPLPYRLEGSEQDLKLESVLRELPLYEFSIAATCPSREIVAIFEQYPLLPGVILQQQGRLLGLISRQRLLESLIRPEGMGLFLDRPVSVLHSHARTDVLWLLEDTPIVTAAQRALRRSPELQGEPILVESPDQTYRLLNVHDLNIAYWQIRGIETQVRYERIQMQMIHNEKMANLGALVDGVAHEILDPVGFIWGNLSHLTTYGDQLIALLRAYEAYLPTPPSAIADLKEAVEWDYLQDDLPRAIESIRSGAERLKKLASGLQNFCHIDEVYPKPADLNACLDGILLLLKSRLANEIQVVCEYGHLPPVSCYLGQLGQVFMNLLVHAVDSLLDEAVRQKLAVEAENTTSISHRSRSHVQKPCIEVKTQLCDQAEVGKVGNPSDRWVRIIIADNGPGMTAEQQRQVEESFSVERRATKETSLAMSYRIVTAKHGGELRLRSPRISDSHSPGTEFEILLPLT